MSLPDLLDPTVPPDVGEAIDLGPSRIRALAAIFADVFGLPVSPTQINGAVSQITAGGIVTFVQQGVTLAGDPTSALHAATKQYVDKHANATGSATGTNTYAVTLAPVPASLAALQGVPIFVTFANANTGAATLAPNGFAATPIKKNGGDALAAGDLLAGIYYILFYDGTNFQLISPPNVAYSVLKTADQSVTSSTTLVNDSALLFPVLANETWRFDATLFTHDGGGGIDLSFTGPASLVALYFVVGRPGVDGQEYQYQSGSGTRITFLGAGGSPYAQGFVNVSGVIANGATAGNVQLQFAQNGSNANATTIKAQSHIRAWRLA